MSAQIEPTRKPSRTSAGSIEGILRRIGPQPVVRGAFFAFFVYLCWQLYAFAQWALGNGPQVDRPEAVAGIIPVGAFMSFFAWLKGGGFDVVAPAGIVIIIGAIATSLLMKKGFCGWICPVGSLWRFFEWLGVKRLGHTLRPPRWLDLGLRGLKYVLTILPLGLLALLSLATALDFQRLPYYAVADIRILQIMLSWQWWTVAAVAAVASFFFGNVWCRYLCPLGGFYSLFGLGSACTVTRDPRICIDCGSCSRQCHAWADPQHSIHVRAAECDGCMNCVRACPEPGALQGRLLGVAELPPWVWGAIVVALWLLVYAVALASGHWSSGVPVEAWPAYVRSVIGPSM